MYIFFTVVSRKCTVDGLDHRVKNSGPPPLRPSNTPTENHGTSYNLNVISKKSPFRIIINAIHSAVCE